MTAEQIQYWAMWASLAAALGTLIAAGVTAWMAVRTAQMATATANMADAARDELQFMRTEADEQTKANVRVPEVRANVGNQFDVCGWFSALNVGPSRAYRVRWWGWYEFAGHPGVMGHGMLLDDDPVRIDKDQQRRESFMLALPAAATDSWLPRTSVVNDAALLRERKRIVESAKEMWLFVTWMDEADRAWAHLALLVGQPNSEAFAIRKRWPSDSDRGVRLGHDDPLATPEILAPSALLEEVRRRLASE